MKKARGWERWREGQTEGDGVGVDVKNEMKFAIGIK